MRILVTSASKHGATAEIAEAVAAGLNRAGHTANARPAEAVEDVEGYDAIVLGSAVYGGRWLPAARRLAGEHAAALAQRDVWLFSSGPIGSPDPKPEGDPVDVAALIEETGAHGHRTFMGSLDKAKLGFAERAIVRALRAPLGDFRDWTAVDAFVDEIARCLAESQSAART